jgi:hypothetical protein
MPMPEKAIVLINNCHLSIYPAKVGDEKRALNYKLL